MTASSGSSSDEDTALCVGCGLCCDGTLYSRVRAEVEEEARLEKLGHQLTSVEGSRYFLLPCQHHESGRCSIYQERFAKCRSFECALLRRYEAGELDLAEARTKIRTAKELLARIKVIAPADLSQKSRADYRARLESDLARTDGDDGEAVARQLVQVIALETYLDRWFLNKRSQTHS